MLSYVIDFFLLETMDTTKKQVMRGLQICKECSKDNIEHRDG